MGAGTVHPGGSQYILMFSVGACSLMLVASSLLPSSATELGNCAENAPSMWGVHRTLGRLSRRSPAKHRGVLLSRVLQQALGTPVIAWKYLGCAFPFQGLSISCSLHVGSIFLLICLVHACLPFRYQPMCLVLGSLSRLPDKVLSALPLSFYAGS